MIYRLSRARACSRVRTASALKSSRNAACDGSGSADEPSAGDCGSSAIDLVPAIYRALELHPGDVRLGDVEVSTCRKDLHLLSAHGIRERQAAE